MVQDKVSADCPSKMGFPVRQSIPRQVDKKSRVPEEEKEVWGSQGGDRSLEFSRRKKGDRKSVV